MVIKNRNYVGIREKPRPKPIFTNKYEFECPESKTAGIFLRVLHGFDIEPEDVTMSEKNLDYSLVIFRTDRKTRLNVEYTLREFLKLKPLYLRDVDWSESSLELTCNDGYVIF